MALKDLDVTDKSAEQLLALVNLHTAGFEGVLLFTKGGRMLLRRLNWVPPADEPDDEEE